MALPTSGPLTLSQIQTEFGGSNPISLSEYYAGGANVPSGTTGTNGAVPSSGAISIANFYGTQKVAPTFSFTISSHQANANLRSLAVAAGWNQSQPVVATLAGGYYIYSTGTGTPALTINGSWPGGVTFVNNGYVMGQGGGGGGMIYNGSTFSYNTGLSAGGNAISLGVSCTIQNNSYIGGGGGGGGFAGNTLAAGTGHPGGGGAGGGQGGGNNNNGTIAAGGAGGGIGSSGGNGVTSPYLSAGGGGRIMPGSNVTSTSSINGGASFARSTGGGAGNAGSAFQNGIPSSGSNTSNSVGGAGGSGGGAGSCYTGNIQYGTANIAGGGGGGWGASGSSSVSTVALTNSTFPGAAGGKCVALNGYTATFTTIGTRYGAIS
jgi:hypothetical protein